jgi:hypothetical protein
MMNTIVANHVKLRRRGIEGGGGVCVCFVLGRLAVEDVLGPGC